MGLFFNEIVIVHIYGITLVFNGVTIAPIGDLRRCTMGAPAVATEACTRFRYKTRARVSTVHICKKLEQQQHKEKAL